MGEEMSNLKARARETAARVAAEVQSDGGYNQDALETAIEAALLEFNSEKKLWVGLTDDEVGGLSDFAYDSDEEFVRNVEAKLKEKNA